MALDNLSGLSLILTSQCNMRCSYCYQHAQGVRNMSWRTLRASLDFALRSSNPRLNLLFYGGEPLLRFAQIRRAVAHAASRTSDRKRFRYELVTNGLLLSPDKADFLEENNFTVLLSFDGPGSQAARGAGTFERLESLVERLKVRNPRLFNDLLTVVVTVTPRTIQYLASSVDYFIGNGIPRIAVAAAITHFPEWDTAGETELDIQFQRVCGSSQVLRNQSGKLRLTLLSPVRKIKEWDQAECSAAQLSAPTVDVDGSVYPCPLFARSVQGREVAPFAEVQALGRIDDPNLEAQLAVRRTSRLTSELFAGRRFKYTRYRRCADCDEVGHCLVCPFSAAYIPGNRDASRVSDFVCAFNRIALKYRDLLSPHTSEPTAGLALQQLREWLSRATSSLPHSGCG